MALNNNSRSVGFFFSIYCFESRSKVFTQDAATLLCLCQRHHPVATTHFNFHFQLLTCSLCFASQKLVRLCGDAHRQLRDGGRGGDVHQARLSAVHLGPVSSSGVSMRCSFRSPHSCALSDVGRESAFGATPTLPFPHFSRLLNHHSIHVLPLFSSC